MLTLLYLLILEQVLLGLQNLWDGFQWLRRAQRRMASHAGFYAPRAAVICPVKGMEPGLEENLAALANFDYPDYEIYFAMASIEDPTRKIIDRLSASSKRRIHTVLAGRPDGCGEKVNNLRAAVQQAGDAQAGAGQEGNGFDVYVFVDSDGRPGRHWLARMVAPLQDANLGAVTTMRWLFQQRGGFYSALASAWNAPIATYLGDHNHNFCWGGGTAIRRERFEQIGAYDYWIGSVSDDLSLTSALRQANAPILFAPECLVPTIFDCDAKGLLNFTNRQVVIARVYEPKLWMRAGFSHLLYSCAILLALALSFTGFITGVPTIHLLLLALIPPLLCISRGVLRLAAVMELLPDWKAKLLADSWIWTLLAAVVPFLFLWNGVVASFSRQIRWRGIRYQLISPNKTRILIP